MARNKSTDPTSLPKAETQSQPVLSHVFEPLNAYPGETVFLYTSLVSGSPAQQASVLRIGIPTGMEVISSQQLSGSPLPPSLLEVTSYRPQVTELVWRLPASRSVATLELKTEMRLLPANNNPFLSSPLRGMPNQAQAISVAYLSTEDGNPITEESTCLVVHPAGKYLRYLPELYAEDDLMGRFLMLFESFWRPIERQVAGIEHYFDPYLTPPAFLPWLASWVGLELNNASSSPPGASMAPIERHRQLIKSAVLLNRSRGTAGSLKAFLEIYTGGTVEIAEHRANDLRLGTMAVMGPNIALGIGNHPHTFTVTLHLPPSAPGNSSKSQRDELYRSVRRIIDEQRPAHASYALQITDRSESSLSEASTSRKNASSRTSTSER
ncbi:MAG: hypothetical protein JW726_00880 [Anaerolineales bacterium]|nr:hypothetical protein [Anaerolineales bacterium]